VNPIACLLLGLAPLVTEVDLPASDPAQLRELLHDRQHTRSQSQAALLLVQSKSPDAETIVRQGLRQTDSADVFLALAAAIRLQQDARFLDELLIALGNGRPAVRQAAADALAELSDPRVILRLQARAENAGADLTVRQAAIATLGRSGRKAAVVVLLDLLSNDNEAVRKAAVDALGELTGQSCGADLDRWRAWWERHKDLSNEQWLAQRLGYQSSHARRLAGDLERARAEVLRLHQQLYTRLPAADRLSHVQSLVEHEDPAARALAATWCVELMPSADALGQRTLADVLLRLSRDGTVEVQRAAVLALGRVPEERAFERLRLLLRKGQPSVRAAAARALAQQARGTGPQALARQKEVVPALQQALDDPALEVVIEAAENLGTMGVPEVGPVLTALLRHPSDPVRQAAAQALERGADLSQLDGLLAALEDPAASVRFSIVGALGNAVGDGKALTAPQRHRLLERLEGLLLRDTDPGVRSRAASVLGQIGSPALLATLWRRVLAAEDSRVQEKAWAAIIEIIARAGSLELLQEWDRTLIEAKQGPRRLLLLGEVHGRWKKREETRALARSVEEKLVPAQLEQGKWAAAFPLVRELLAQSSGVELNRCLSWLLTVGEQALKEGNRAEALRVVQEAQTYLSQSQGLAAEFERLEKDAKKP
jgi:HEAT repeat protein